ATVSTWRPLYGSIRRVLKTRPADGGAQTIQDAWRIFAMSGLPGPPNVAFRQYHPPAKGNRSFCMGHVFEIEIAIEIGFFKSTEHDIFLLKYGNYQAFRAGDLFFSFDCHTDFDFEKTKIK
ncbi:MAG: hypothetical protein ACQEQN_05890, partial [Thermodesulfobacteriota bacterium]